MSRKSYHAQDSVALAFQVPLRVFRQGGGRAHELVQEDQTEPIPERGGLGPVERLEEVALVMAPSRRMKDRDRDGPSPFNSGRPPHRSQRALLTHWALPRMLTSMRAAAWRMRASALGTLVRLCVRGVFCSPTFSLAKLLPSIASAAVPPALFGNFVGTTSLSDFLRPFIIGVRPWAFPTRPALPSGGRTEELPVLAHGVSVHARGLRPRRTAPELALSLMGMLPSAPLNNVGILKRLISRLNTLPALPPVNASP